MQELIYANAQPAIATLDPVAPVPHLYALMLRNIATDAWRFADPNNPSQFSRPGCVIASPSYPLEDAAVNQDYVYNWTRDAAFVAVELARVAAEGDVSAVHNLADWASFAEACQLNAAAPSDRASWRIDAGARDPWSQQSDGPALRIIAGQQMLPLLDSDATIITRRVIDRDLDYVLRAYRSSTTGLWEDHSGQSFFARSAHLRCLRELSGTEQAAARQSDVDKAMIWLEAALAAHWDQAAGIYRSLIEGDAPDGYDPNIDIVFSAVYGAVDVLNPKLLSTAGRLRAVWDDTSSTYYYPINAADAARGIGPLLGRYPEDEYDGDTGDRYSGFGHPWPVSTAAFAELYYQVGTQLATPDLFAVDALNRTFYAQVGVDAGTSVADARQLLLEAGDRMLRAVLFHSDHLELSEQFDGTTGFEKSVHNLSWSYAAYLSAARSRSGAAAL